ncbi:MAG: hypothetical protein JXQ80_09430, partial [Bacteroidales bacterium]|nr:hypothetical protein [Bacteroidales bacterium]
MQNTSKSFINSITGTVFQTLILSFSLMVCCIAVSAQTRPEGKKISPLLFGLFFEDINYAADGGLYAELIQNRSFEYNPTERRE